MMPEGMMHALLSGQVFKPQNVLENKPATISRDETCGRKLLAGI